MARRSAVTTASSGLILAALALTSAACGSGDRAATDPDRGTSRKSAGTNTCVEDATAVTTTPTGYPRTFPLPKDTVVFDVEDRGADGVIATGVTRTPFHDVLAAMNAADRAGFEVTSGETEDDDAEASWTGNGFTGRWAIKRSASCPGQTVVQLLARAR